MSLAHAHAHTQSFTLGARPRYSSLHTQTQSFIYTIYSSISENRVIPMAQLVAWWRGVRRTSPSSPRIHMAPGVLPHKTPARHSGETKAPADTVRKPKQQPKEQAWNKTDSLSGHIQLLKAFYQLYNLSNRIPSLVSHNLSPRYITAVHLHHHRDTLQCIYHEHSTFNIRIFTISNLRLKL